MSNDNSMELIPGLVDDLPVRGTASLSDGSYTDLSTIRIWLPSQPVTPISDTDLLNRVNNLQTKVIIPATGIQSPLGKSGVPKSLLSVSATESPTKQQGRTMSEVSVMFTADPSDSNFSLVKIWFVGYQGSSTAWLMAQGTKSPVTFLCETTKETVSVLVQPIGTSGQSAPLAFANTTTVVLDGVVSPPPAPSVSQMVVPIVGGFQFTFGVEAGLLEDVISGYNIYRSERDDLTTATKIDFIAQDPNNTGTVVYQDHCGGDMNEFYWVSAVNTVALESGLTPCQTSTTLSGTTTNSYGSNGVPNPSFDANTVGVAYNTALTNAVYTPVADGWYVAEADGHNYWSTQLENNVHPRTGSNNLLLRLSTGITVPNDGVTYGQRVFSSNQLPVSTGDYIRVSSWIRWDNTASLPTGVNVVQRVGFYVYSQDGTNIGELVKDITDASLGTGSWNNDTVTYQIPSLLGGLPPAYVVVELAAFVQNTSGSAFTTGTSHYADLRYDDIKVVTQQTAFDSTPLNTSYSNNSLSSVLSNDGTDTVIDVASFQIQYGDGLVSYSSGSVDPGSYGAFYIYFADPTYSGGAVTYVTTSSWSSVFAANGNILVGKVTTAHSAPTSGGGGGGGDICFLPDVKLFDGKAISEHVAGDYVRTKNGFRRILTMHTNPYKGLLCHMGSGEWVTEKHAFVVGGTPKAASDLWPPTRYYEGDVWNLTIDTEDEEERNYFLANGMLSHNMIDTCILLPDQ